MLHCEPTMGAAAGVVFVERGRCTLRVIIGKDA
jgi:hypothetical protein